MYLFIFLKTCGVEYISVRNMQGNDTYEEGVTFTAERINTISPLSPVIVDNSTTTAATEV